jgi:hypothetical protein
MVTAAMSKTTLKTYNSYWNKFREWAANEKKADIYLKELEGKKPTKISREMVAGFLHHYTTSKVCVLLIQLHSIFHVTYIF